MNVLKPHKKSTILTLTQNHVSQREINRKTGIDRKTIRKYQQQVGWPDGGISNSPMATGSDPPEPLVVDQPSGIVPETSPSPDQPRPQILSASTCVLHHEFITAEVVKGRNGMAIYQDLVERFGFEHKYNAVKRYVRKLKRVEPEQYDRLEFLPGEEAQVDYGQGAFTKHPKTGNRRRPRLFVMTLAYSRRAFRKTVWKSSKQVWAKLHEEAFRYFGGCPQYVVLDNLKEGVIKPDIYEPELNSVYREMLTHYGVVADAARVRDPDRKGRVENAIQHTQNTALKGKEFDDIESQNKWLMHWEERWAAPRIHGRAKRQVEEMFQEEKPYLKSLPLMSFSYFEEGIRTVGDDGLVEVARSYYAARPAPLFSLVLVRIYDCNIEILDRVTLTVIRRHIKSTHPGSVDLKESDRVFNPSRQTQNILEQASRIGPKTRELCEQLFTEQGRPGQRRMWGIVGLARRHAAPVIEKACQLAVERNVRSSKTVREIVERFEKQERESQKSQTQNITEKSLIQSHALIRDPKDYGLFFEQHAAQGEPCSADKPIQGVLSFTKETETFTNQEQNHEYVNDGNREVLENFTTLWDSCNA